MALTALKIYNNTCSEEAPVITVWGYVSDAKTYTIPEGSNYGTAILLSCQVQTGSTAVSASVSGTTVTFSAPGVEEQVVALRYTFQK